MDPAALLVEIVSENGLGDLFGDTEIESIDASAAGEIERSECFSAGVDLDGSLFATGIEEFFDEAQRLENLERAGMHDGRAIPVKRRRARVDEMAGYVASLKLGCEKQPRGTRADDEHGRLLVWRVGVRRGPRLV